MSKRENILANFKTVLSEISGAAVYRRIYDPNISEIQALWGSSEYLLVIVDGEEESRDGQKGPEKYINELVVDINGYILDLATPSTSLNTLLDTIKIKVEEDRSRDGNAMSTYRLRVDLLPGLEPPYAGFKAQYSVKFYE
jgi:hypothetical protein